MTEALTAQVVDRLRAAQERRRGQPRRLGLELKFPVVACDTGKPPERDVLQGFWAELAEHGWSPFTDSHTSAVVGVERNDGGGKDVFSSATGYCVLELSTAPEPDLHALRARVSDALNGAVAVARGRGLALLGHGIHPVAEPSPELMTAKGRNVFWDEVFEREDPTCRVHLFTTTAASQVHLDVGPEEAADALVVFNGLAPAQIALNANSGVWGGRPDPDHRCVHEVFWDRWLPGEDRVGMPRAKPESLEAYLSRVVDLRPVYVEREGEPVMLPEIGSFAEFARRGESTGQTADGRPVTVSMRPEDLELHLTFLWHNARLSRYSTLENRVNCQQPPEAMLSVGALALGLGERLREARELVDAHDWEALRRARQDAIRRGLGAEVAGAPIAGLVKDMLAVARAGLRARGRGEDAYLDPLLDRSGEGRCPADVAAERFRDEGITGLLARFALGGASPRGG